MLDIQALHTLSGIGSLRTCYVGMVKRSIYLPTGPKSEEQDSCNRDDDYVGLDRYGASTTWIQLRFGDQTCKHVELAAAH
jgi:hypothetical protein